MNNPTALIIGIVVALVIVIIIILVIIFVVVLKPSQSSSNSLLSLPQITKRGCGCKNKISQ